MLYIFVCHKATTLRVQNKPGQIKERLSQKKTKQQE